MIIILRISFLYPSYQFPCFEDLKYCIHTLFTKPHYRNPLIDYCASTQQVAVGSAEGLVHMFDIKTSKCHPLHAHSAAITCLSLSPNGRALITYSEREGKVTIWQVSAGVSNVDSFIIVCWFLACWLCFLWKDFGKLCTIKNLTK